MATQSLFDIIYSSTSTPVKVENLRLQNEEEKLKIKGEGIALENQQAFQKAMQQLWGPGGEATAAGASQTGDPGDDQRLKATASLLYRFGDAGKATQVMNTLSLINERKVIEQQKGMWTERQRTAAIAGITSSITDQDTYSAALPTLQQTMTPQQWEQFAPSGYYDDDKVKLATLAQSATTYAQKEKLAADAAKQVSLNAYRNRGLGLREEALKQGWARIGQGDQRLINWGQHEAFAEEMGWRRDARAQEGANTRAAAASNKGTKNPPKLEPTERALGPSTFAADPRTRDIPADMRDVLASQAMLRAKREYPDEPFPEALEQTMNEMESEGAFKPKGKSWTGRPQYDYTYTGPKGGPKPAPTKIAAGKGEAGNYPTVDSVKEAYKRGDFGDPKDPASYDKAAKILREKFGAK